MLCAVHITSHYEWVMKGVSLRDGAVQTLELEKLGSVAAAYSSDIFKKHRQHYIFGLFLEEETFLNSHENLLKNAIHEIVQRVFNDALYLPPL